MQPDIKGQKKKGASFRRRPIGSILIDNTNAIVTVS